MPRILTRCLADGVAVPTGHFMSEVAFAAVAGRFSFRCSRCQTVHHWRREDAWLEGQPPRLAPIVEHAPVG